MPKKPTVVVETEAEVRRASSIRPQAIQEEYVAVPSDIARWAGVVAEANRDLAYAEAELEHFEHSEKERLVDEAEAEARGAGKVGEIRPPGEDRLKSAVRGGTGYLARKRAVADAEYVKAKAFAVLEAVRSKREMLVSLGADLRQEIEASLRDGNGIRDRGSRRA